MKPGRRQFLKAASAAAVLYPGLAATASQIPRFSREATAENVTSGLDLAGQTVVITGCNSGLGLETMRVLAMRGAHVVGTARTLRKARRACRSVAGTTTPLGLELSDFDSVADAVEEIREMRKPIDVLVCNAAVMGLPELETVYGIEKQFVVNHLGHFLLVNKLLERIRIAKQGRIVFLTTSAGRTSTDDRIDLDNLSGEKGYSPLTAYAQSKLANALCSVELARRLGFSNPATSNSVYPGLVKTGIRRHLAGRTGELMRSIESSMGKPVTQGASTPCFVAARPELSDFNGRYFQDNQLTIPLRQMADIEMARKLWIASEEITRPWFG